MPAYIIVELLITDKEGYGEYKRLAPTSISSYDGKYIIRGGRTESLEGNWNPERIAVLEFPTFERAKEWYASEMYKKARSIRQQTAITKMILIEGC